MARLYIRCFECCHPYRTRWHLLFAFWREWIPIWWRDWRMSGVSSAWRTRWWHLFRGWYRPGRIPFCQCCTHDF